MAAYGRDIRILADDRLVRIDNEPLEIGICRHRLGAHKQRTQAAPVYQKLKLGHIGDAGTGQRKPRVD
jgi:hypothetical protein